MIRDDIKAALVAAMKGGDKAATGTIRLIQSAIKNRDIELRTSSAAPDDDALVTEVLQKMIKQRRESIALYEQGGRQELADAEKAEHGEARGEHLDAVGCGLNRTKRGGVEHVREVVDVSLGHLLVCEREMIVRVDEAGKHR